MAKAYAILFIDKATRQILRATVASDFPVTGLFSEAQVVLAQNEGKNYDGARFALVRMINNAHAWSVPLFNDFDKKTFAAIGAGR